MLLCDWKATFSSNADIMFLLTLTWWVQCISAFIQDKACYIYASFLSLFVCLLTAVFASRKESWDWMLHSMHSLKLLSLIFKIAHINKGCFKTSWKLDWSEEKGKRFDFCSLISVRTGSRDVRYVVVVGKGVVHYLWLWGSPLCHTHKVWCHLPILWP